jgi:lycopene cyclase domain-containing protein
MTYFGFLARFLAIPIALLLALAIWDRKNNRPAPGFRNGRAVWMAIGLHVVLAVAYTTPWDNYLVATGVWYYNPDLVTGLLIGYVPIEEYTFFILEATLAGLWWWSLARRVPLPAGRFAPNKRLVFTTTGLLLVVWLVSTGLFISQIQSIRYLSITLFWALPAILAQTLFGADILWRYRRLVAWAVLVPGTYLSLIDIFALNDTTWSISKAQTTGLLFFGILPLEEVVFFYLTSALIAFGMTLLLAQESQIRLAQFKARFARLPDRGSTSSSGTARR